jgi:uncharacterized membrane protein YeaQ/YmgE (transglycosylase-associated protein family)
VLENGRQRQRVRWICLAARFIDVGNIARVDSMSAPITDAEVAMGIFSWIMFGLIAGAIAKLIMPGKDPGGILLTIVLGVVGAIVGGYFGTMLGYGTVNGFDVRGLVIAVLGSLILLIGYRVIVPRVFA